MEHAREDFSLAGRVAFVTEAQPGDTPGCRALHADATAIPLFRNTSRYPAAEVRALIAFATANLDLRDVAFNVRNTGGAYAGRAYFPVPPISTWYGHPGAASLIVLRIGVSASFPCTNLTTTIRKTPLTPWLPAGAVFPSGEDIRYQRTRQGRREVWRAVRVAVSRHPYGGKRSPLIEMRTWQECLVALAAHEAQHIAQFRARTRKSEAECERYAAARLAHYRTLAPPHHRTVCSGGDPVVTVPHPL